MKGSAPFFLLLIFYIIALEKLVDFYKNEKFLQVLPLNTTAEIKNVKYSNNCQISLHENYRKNKLIIIRSYDNI